MDSIIGKLIAPHYTEYCSVADDWLILETSSGVQRFADCPNEVITGKDVRLGFPELRKYENYITDIVEGRQKSFELKGIARFKEHNYRVYIDLFIISFEKGFIVILEEVTERIVLEEKLAERNREANHLFDALAASYNYIDKIITSIKDAFFVTTPSGNIITVNQAALDLFEYSQEELILKQISTIIADENFLLQARQQHLLSKSDFLKDCEVVCQTKTARKLIVNFSVVSTKIEGLQHFVYIGRDITQRQRTEQLQGVEHATTRILANSTTLFEATANIVSTICSSLGWEVGEFWSVDRQDNLLRLGSNWHIPSVNFPKSELVSQQITFAPGVGLPGRIWASGEPTWINNVVHDDNLCRESVVKEGLHTAFGFPIKCGSEITGVMTFFSRKIEEEQSDLLMIMAVIGSQIGQFILRCQAEAALRESEERFQAFMNNSPAVAFMKDSEGRFVYVNKTLERNFDIKQADLQGKTDFDWLPEQTAQQVRENDLYVLSTGKTTQIIETVPTPDGCLHHWLSLKFPFTDSQGRQLVGGVAIDITERQLLEQELFEEKELAQVTLQSIGDGVITTDASGFVKYLNPVAEELTGWTLQDAQGKPLAEVFKVVNEITQETVENPVEKALRSGCIVGLAKDSVLITRNGAEIAVDDSAAPIRAKDGHIVGAVMVFQDVSQTRSMARQLSWQATHDALTGLFNRREFEYRLELALSSAKTLNQQHVLCYLDLDRFKIVNDTCGHIAGDELLRQVTTLLQTLVRSSDTLARLGGDEFAILLEVCPLEPAVRIAHTLLQRIQEFRFVWLDKTFNIGVSIGLVVINADSQSMNSLLSAADAACYVAKNKGRHRVHIYQADDGDLAKAQGEMQWVARIADALEENRFCLYYQPIVPTKPTQASGEHCEVLLRLIDEQGNIVSPMAFIPAAERYNLMQAIDRWVIRTFFASLAQYEREKCTRLQKRNCDCLYAINLSGASINDDQFMDFLREQLTLHHIPPQTICFEITETIAVANLGKAALLIRSLRELGCRFALDDFGSGMSSFSYLKNLPVDYLKIDGSFVKHIVEEPIDLAMVEAINQIGHVMGIQTIAEFVENEDILEKIKLLGVDYAQGYGIAKPRPFT